MGVWACVKTRLPSRWPGGAGARLRAPPRVAMGAGALEVGGVGIVGRERGAAAVGAAAHEGSATKTGGAAREARSSAGALKGTLVRLHLTSPCRVPRAERLAGAVHESQQRERAQQRQVCTLGNGQSKAHRSCFTLQSAAACYRSKQSCLVGTVMHASNSRARLGSSR